MDNITGQSASFEESLSSKIIPSQSASALLAIPPGVYSKTNAVVQDFLVQSISEMLDDPAVQADLCKRVNSVTGGSSGTPHCHSHGATCSHYHISPAELLEIAPLVVEQAAQTFSNVASRAPKDAPPLDSSTAGFLRRKIFTESIVREVVKREHGLHMKRLESQSREGAFFAFPNPEQMDMDRLHMLSSVHMQELMNRGYTVVSDFFGSPEELKSIYRELVRLDALALLRPAGDDIAVYWAILGNLRTSLYVSRLCEQLSLLSFELNTKHKELFLQVVQQFQISKSKDAGKVEFTNRAQKIACIFPLGEENHQRMTINLATGPETVRVDSGDLVVVNTARVSGYEYQTERRFQVAVFLTGPGN